jgi:anhydro-N-acetylmuramic acid kinase
MMASARPYRAIGLMSGTSLDGIDAAFLETDGRGAVLPGPALTIHYPDGLRERIRGTLGGHGPVGEVEREMTLAHAAAVRELMRRYGVGTPDVVGFHGHTILHRPEARRTWQIGDGALLARELGTEVVCDFRSADVAAGGQGAPLAPAYHRAILGGHAAPAAVLNIGGVANVTFLDPEEDRMLAFDTGPGNALHDDWVLSHAGARCDRDGALARAGKVDEGLLRDWLALPYFDARPPKSLDRDDFAGCRPDGLSVEDGAATLAAFTAAAVTRHLPILPALPRHWLVSGGGRRNPAIMSELSRRLGAPVAPIEDAGFDGDALEAQAFAYLAVRALEGLPISFPGTTGAPRPLSGGRVFRPVA